MKKIIPEGIVEAEFGEFIQHFMAEKISVYGSVTQEQEKMEASLALSFAL